MTSILFYLPVATPWWFGRIVAPMIRAASCGGRVSVLAPPLWRNTGVGPDTLAALRDLPEVEWHILDGPDHPALRAAGRAHDAVAALVRDIAPDLVLCRTADLATPALFPGVVRHIMEGAAPPFATDPSWVRLAPSLFDHGMMPPLDAHQHARLDAAFAPCWNAARGRYAGDDRAAFLAAAGLPADRRIIGAALEFEHPEIFFGAHHRYDNVALIDHLAAQLGDDCVLACTTHPLTELQGDPAPLHAAAARHGGRVRILPRIGALGDATMRLAAHADGFVVQNSKCYAAAGFFGTPLLRFSDAGTGGWMLAADDARVFLAAVRNGTAPAPAEEDARLWFAAHFLNDVFDPADPALDAAALLARATLAVDERRWPAAVERVIAGGIAGARIAGPERRAMREMCHV